MRRLLAGLPDWFGIPAAIEPYTAAPPTYLALVDGTAVGVLLLRRRFATRRRDPPGGRRHTGSVAGLGAPVTELTAEGVPLLRVTTRQQVNPGPRHHLGHRDRQRRPFDARAE
ncbi:hypothetical protein [Actinocatenispora rupis]|uniref:Uncharacterized protein n=1 Tax=Actinocatenispora rupis TaxID=519421 RepID=A0A8J3J9N4_9ACTN|nr:hypothetical protein [Actinocatenispora rupis]GID12639.1 hypothetical protein Aru02nite_35280 [Actinocatenispora rupis]